jgi:hypothetical protein
MPRFGAHPVFSGRQHLQREAAGIVGIGLSRNAGHRTDNTDSRSYDARARGVGDRSADGDGRSVLSDGKNTQQQIAQQRKAALGDEAGPVHGLEL